MARKSPSPAVFPAPGHDHDRCASEGIAHAEALCAARHERLTAIRRRVLEALGPTPTPLDEILRQAETNPGTVRAVLIELELAGRLQRDPGDRLSLIPEEYRPD